VRWRACCWPSRRDRRRDGIAVPGYLNPQNQINLLELSIEKGIVVLR